MIKILIRLFVYLVCNADAAFASEYFVALHRDDNNVGDKDYPLKTIFKASELAMPGDTVSIMGGEYTLQKQFRSVRSGNFTQ